MSDAEAVTKLNFLVTVCQDRASALRAAAGEPGTPRHLQVLRSAERWAYLADELRVAVRKLGGAPASHLSVKGGLHRAWIYIKSTANEDATIQAECVRRDAAALAQLHEALHESWAASVRAPIQRFLKWSQRAAPPAG